MLLSFRVGPCEIKLWILITFIDQVQAFQYKAAPFAVKSCKRERRPTSPCTTFVELYCMPTNLNGLSLSLPLYYNMIRPLCQVLKGGSTCSRLLCLQLVLLLAPVVRPALHLYIPQPLVLAKLVSHQGGINSDNDSEIYWSGSVPQCSPNRLAGHSFQFIRKNLLALFVSLEYRQYINLNSSLIMYIL